MIEVILDHMHDARLAAALIARFELHLLTELGFGLELDRCALTGLHEGLFYVSPKSGRAVSQSAGAPWHDRLLRLPLFLTAEVAGSPAGQDIADAFALTGHFMAQRVLEPHGLGFADARAGFVAAVLAEDANASGGRGSCA
jgi:DNA repair protein RecO (recombination protein O)